eukprot:11086985-Heterocapsa_arctica.AAC.1
MARRSRGAMPPSAGRVLDPGSSTRSAQARPPPPTTHATPAAITRNALPLGPSTPTPRKGELTPGLQDPALTRHHTPGVLDLGSSTPASTACIGAGAQPPEWSSCLP